VTYAQQFGFRPATRAEKQARGFRPSSRAYTSPSGEVVSHRQLQTMGIQERYGEAIDKRTALEERARVRREELGMRPATKTYYHMLDRMARTSINKGGLGAKWDEKHQQYILPSGERMGKRELARSEDFRDRESGIWAQWGRIRHQKGPQGERQRFAFLKQYGFLRSLGHGKYRYIPA
jgi:hypothetical protein